MPLKKEGQFAGACWRQEPQRAVDLEPVALRGEVELGGLLAEDVLDAAAGESTDWPQSVQIRWW